MIKPLIRRLKSGMLHVEIPRDPRFRQAMAYVLAGRDLPMSREAIHAGIETWIFDVRAIEGVRRALYLLFSEYLDTTELPVEYGELAWEADRWWESREPDPAFDEESIRVFVSRERKRTAFQVLHVTTDAPREVIEAAYRALAKKYHEASNTADMEKWREVNIAYDSIKRSGALS